jgi:hypothetical protein
MNLKFLFTYAIEPQNEPQKKPLESGFPSN